MERTPYFDLFGASYSGGAAHDVLLGQETSRLKIFEVIAGEGLGIVYYDVEKCDYSWDGNKEKSLLDLLTKRFHQDWWCGYPMYIHSDYKAVLARRINLIVHRQSEDQLAAKELRSFMKGSLEAWKEQLGCVWDEDKKQFIV
ncbi:MAG: hypothetical protein JWM14_2621 [Chitinophagaceae bacterium]|nr:hypothetical protein [Chitinophagaceae bacterium]